MKSYLYIPLTIFIGIILFLWKGLSLKPMELPSVLIGRTVPSFRVNTVEDQYHWVSESSLKGQVTILNVWSIHCQGCQAEQTFWRTLKIEKLALAKEERLTKDKRSAKQGSLIKDGSFAKQETPFSLVGLNYHDALSETQHWLKTVGNPYRFTLFDKAGRLAMDFGVYGTPETFLVDKVGIIRHRHVGPVDADIWQHELLPLLKVMDDERGQ